jgi:ribosomal protein S18 acetylase RimI-like enzyme
VTKIEIKQLQPNDAEYIADVAKMFTELTNYHARAEPKVFVYPGPTKTPEFVKKIITNEDNAVFVALKDGTVVGAAQVSIVAVEDKPGWRSRKYGYLDRLFVIPNSRRQGIATALVRAREDWLKFRSIDVAEMNTWAFNIETQALYKKLGYDVKNINMWRKLN